MRVRIACEMSRVHTAEDAADSEDDDDDDADDP